MFESYARPAVSEDMAVHCALNVEARPCRLLICTILMVVHWWWKLCRESAVQMAVELGLRITLCPS